MKIRDLMRRAGACLDSECNEHLNLCSFMFQKFGAPDLDSSAYDVYLNWERAQIEQDAVFAVLDHVTGSAAVKDCAHPFAELFAQNVATYAACKGCSQWQALLKAVRFYKSEYRNDPDLIGFGVAFDHYMAACDSSLLTFEPSF